MCMHANREICLVHVVVGSAVQIPIPALWLADAHQVSAPQSGGEAGPAELQALLWVEFRGSVLVYVRNRAR